MELFISSSYLLRLDAYFSLVFLGLFNFSKPQIKILEKTFLISSLVVVILGFVQFIFYNNLRNLYYLGWDEHLYRMFSTFLDPNFMGLYLALLSIFIVGQIIKASKKNTYFYSHFIFAGITLLALVLTYSRTAIISLVLGIAFMAIYLKKIKVFTVSIILLFGGVLALSNFSIEGMNPVRIASSEARLESMREALEIFSDSPIYGVGFNTYRYAQISKGFRDEKLSIVSNADAGTDNSFLFVLATTGVIGIFTYLNIWRQIIVKIRKLNKSNKAIAFSIIVTLFTASFFINGLFYMPIMLWVFVYFGMHVLKEKN
jgi:O-antigen ligase